MKNKYFFSLLLVLLTACNAGSDSTQVAGGGIGGTGISIGSISAFSSIFVNGIKFETDNSIIMMNGQQVDEMALKLGMVVRVEGIIHPETQTGQASLIEFNENVKGAIQYIDLNQNILTVLGQTVLIKQDTIFSQFNELMDLQLGDVVHVSGFVNADSSIHATHIERDNNLNNEFEVTGQVTQLDVDKHTFQIGQLWIDYSHVLQMVTLKNALNVEVKGQFDSATNTLHASFISASNELNATAGTRVEIEGFVTRFDSDSDFAVAQVNVKTNPQTVFLFGDSDDLKLGALVEVEGVLDADGHLNAEEINFSDAASQRSAAGLIEIEANIESIEQQRLQLLGLPIQLTETTQYQDRRDGLMSFGLSDLAVNDRVVIGGFLDFTTNQVVAEVVLRKTTPPDDQIVLEGIVNQVEKFSSLEILGVSVQVDSNTLYYQELTHSEQQLTSDQFWEDVQELGLLVDVQGIWLNGIIFATRLEISQ